MGAKSRKDCVRSRRLLNRSLNLTTLILKVAADVGHVTVNSFFPKNYPQARMWRIFLGIDNDAKYSRQTLSCSLARLKKQGLIDKDSGSGKWNLTNFGKTFANKIKFKEKGLEDQKKTNMIVAFDIPEKERKKRAWLRIELSNYGFAALQKSVWIGKGPLPASFIEDLDYLNIRSGVHIVGISKSGTLQTE